MRCQSPFVGDLLYFDTAGEQKARPHGLFRLRPNMTKGPGHEFGRTIEMLFLKQPLILPFICHKSPTTFQIHSNKVSSSKLKPDLCHCVKNEMIEPKALPQ